MDMDCHMDTVGCREAVGRCARQAVFGETGMVDEDEDEGEA